MNKTQFLAALEERLSVVSDAERKRSLLYFEEIIADRMEEGLSEEEVIAQMESPEEIAADIISDIGTEEQNPAAFEKKLGSCPLWVAIILAVLGSPVWLPVLVSVVTVIVTIYSVVWILIGCLYVTAVSLVIGGCVGIVALVIAMGANSAVVAVFAIGLSLFCIGCGILLVFPAVLCTRWYAKGTVWCCRSIAEFLKNRKKEGYGNEKNN